MSNDLVKCNRCKKDKEINCFMKKDKQLKRCEDCRDYLRNYDLKNHCPCSMRKYDCKIHSDAREITIKQMIHGSKYNDIKFNRFDKNQFIDKQFVSNLLDLYENCIYCNCELNLDKRNPKLATIERLDNSLGHIKRNCVVACFTCNVNHVGDKYN